MRVERKAVALLALATLTVGAADLQRSGGPLTQHNVSLNMAMIMAQEAIATCKHDGFNVSVAVVDRAGDMILLLRTDTANPHNAELARRKAYTALTFHVPSREWMQTLVTHPEISAQRDLAQVIALAGGAPVMLGDEPIGAIGVSGATALNEDDRCAKAAVEKVADQLKQGSVVGK